MEAAAARATIVFLEGAGQTVRVMVTDRWI
jgi:hypothetical protein